MYDIIVIGAGAGGLVVAIGSAKAGKKVLLIEKGNYGGDCTNYGCIPSKALIAAAHAADFITRGSNLGIKSASTSFSASDSLKRVQDIVKTVRHHEEPPALKELGVETLTGLAFFVDPQTLKVGEQTVQGKNIIIATGSYPGVPPAEGLKDCPFLTNETIFDLKEIPKSMVFLGGGPIGSELAQAFHRLGSKVSIVQRPPFLLKKEEPEAREIVGNYFKSEGIDLYLGFQLNHVAFSNSIFTLKIAHKETGEEKTLTCDQVVVAAGRKPHVSELNLDAAGITWSEKGIPVDKFGRTNKKNIWAIGDVTGGPLFTHYAEHSGRTVLKNLLLPFKKKINNQAIPRVTYTDPEVAGIGMLEEEARSIYSPSKIAVYHLPFQQIDRALCEGRTEGLIKVITKKWSSKILGVCIIGTRAGEMLATFSLAMKENIPLKKLANVIPPYPTYTQGIRKTADLWLTQTILPSFTRIFKR